MDTNTQNRQVGFTMPAEEYTEFRAVARGEYLSCSRFALRAVRAAIREAKRRAQRRERRAKLAGDAVPAMQEGAEG